jgi:uncharacterized membrane protein YsdA (DUF1294 family)
MIVYLILLNAFSFLLMLLDKRYAVKRLRRIPESTLFLCCILGGCVGILLGMMIARHKIRKKKFYLGVPAILVAQVVLWFMM